MTAHLTLPSGITLRRELVDIGLDDRAIARLVRRGELVRIRHGAYVAASEWPAADRRDQHRLRTRAVQRQAGTALVTSHCSAAIEYDAPEWGLPLLDVDVTRTDGTSGRRQAGVHQHQGILLPGDVVERNGLPLTSGTRTAIDVATVLPTEASLVAVNHLLHEKHTTLEAIWQRYEPMQRHPHTLKCNVVLRLADPAIESVGESRTLFLMWRQGLPRPIAQYPLYDDVGQEIARLDFALPKAGVWLEFDGREKYVKYLREGESVADVVIREKQREDMIREHTGWICVRITWADLRRPELVARRIRDALRRAAAAPRVVLPT